jgi:hypothetical protein
MSDNNGSVLAVVAFGAWVAFVWWYPSSWNAPMALEFLGTGHQTVMLQLDSPEPWRHLVRRGHSLTVAAAPAAGASAASSSALAPGPAGMLTLAGPQDQLPAPVVSYDVTVAGFECPAPAGGGTAAPCFAVLALPQDQAETLLRSSRRVFLWLQGPRRPQR